MESIEIKHYTPETELEKILHKNYTYIFDQAVKYRELSETQAAHLADTTAALWEILDKLYASEQMNLDVKGILEKHNIPIPEGKEVW
jgi:hypothetical protein